MPMNLSDCRCPSCLAGEFRIPREFSREEIVDDAIACTHCGQTFDVVWGIPFLGAYEVDDTLSLLEVVANVGNYRVNGPPASRETFVVHSHRDLEEYHFFPVKSQYRNALGESPAQWSWWPNRYAEFVLLRMLLHDVRLQNKKVLDLGTGTGFSSYPFLQQGADLTGFDISLLLLDQAKADFPQSRWIGGCAHALPFRDGSFDVVAANAALHHLRDIPATVAEMLRVLRPGGWLLTLCDSFRGNSTSEEHECQLFANDPAVLLGVNERVPRFMEFWSSLERFHDALALEVFTWSASGIRTVAGLHRQPHPWSWTESQACAALAEGEGALCIRARLRHPVSIPAKATGKSIISAADFARALHDQTQAISKLAPAIPAEYVDLPLLDHGARKFRLLNGWKEADCARNARAGYQRVRSFLSRDSLAKYLNLELLVPHAAQVSTPQVHVYVDGRQCLAAPVIRGVWTTLAAPLPPATSNTIVAVEIHLQESSHGEPTRRFFVRRLEFGGTPCSSRPGRDALDAFGVPALAEVGELPLKTVTLLASEDYALTLDHLNWLRASKRGIQLICPEGQRAFYASEPGVAVIATYLPPWSRGLATGRQSRPAGWHRAASVDQRDIWSALAIDAISAASPAASLELWTLIRKDGANCPPKYVFLPGAAAELLPTRLSAATSTASPLWAMLTLRQWLRERLPPGMKKAIKRLLRAGTAVLAIWRNGPRSKSLSGKPLSPCTQGERGFSDRL